MIVGSRRSVGCAYDRRSRSVTHDGQIAVDVEVSAITVIVISNNSKGGRISTKSDHITTDTITICRQNALLANCNRWVHRCRLTVYCRQCDQHRK